jgi:hypothetical protein
VTLTLRFEKKRIGELAILLNFKNNVLPWSEVIRVAGGQYPFRKHLFKSDRRFAQYGAFWRVQRKQKK